MLIGNNDDIDIDVYMYARNADVEKEFCKKIYKEKKYNTYKAIKVGMTLTLKDTQIVTDYESDKLKSSTASLSDSYCEREAEQPIFITKEEAGELDI